MASFDQADKETLKPHRLEMANRFYYNPRLQVVRVIYDAKYYDFRMAVTPIQNPSPQKHLILALVSDDILERSSIDEDKLELLPGLVNNEGKPASIPEAYCFLIDKQQQTMTANPQSGSAGFHIAKTDTHDQDQIVASLTPGNSNDYTNTDQDSEEINQKAIGLFINKDGTILIKSKGGSVTLGDEGVHIGGRLFKESSSAETGFMADNTFGDLIPSTIPTASVSWPKLPNFGTIANIANASRKFMSITDKATKGLDIIKRMV